MQLRKVKQQKEVERTIPKIKLFIYSTPFEISTLDLEETAQYLIETAEQCRSHTVITLNWEMISRAFLSKAYRAELAKATLYTPDGAGVVLWMKYLGKYLKAHTPVRVAGVDLVHRILDLIEGSETKIGIIGGRELVKTLAIIDFPLNQAPLLWDGPVFDDNLLQVQQFAKLINDNQIKFLFLAVPTIKQNWLIPQLHTLCPGTTIMGVGGTFDYLGRRKRRAPLFIQRVHLEWFWRLTTENRTAFRYLVIYPLGLLLFTADTFGNLTKINKYFK